MRVLLVATNRMTTPFPVYPIGIDYVATALRGRHEVRTLDLACAGAEAALAQACQEFQPEVVGLSLRIYPGTPLYSVALREGRVGPTDDLLAPRFYLPAGLHPDTIHDLVLARSRGRRHWVVGSGDASTAAIMKRMYQRGQVGPLWDKLVPG